MKEKVPIRLAFVIAMLAIGAAYSNSFGNGFHFDDFHTVVDNPAIRSLKNVPRFFTDASTFSVLPANRTYRPMVSASLALDYALGRGYAPVWFHAGTFVLFLALVGILFGLYRLLLNKVRPSQANAWLALFGAAWFGLHPAMAETVNYVIQRGDLYCTLGCVAALYGFGRWPRLSGTGLYLLPLVFALLSKPTAAVFPVLLMAYLLLIEREGWRRSLLTVAPSVALTGVLLWLQSAMTPKTFAPSILSPWNYRLTQPYVWLRYVAALFLPLHLNVDTDLAAFSTINGEAVAGLAFLTMLGAAIWYTARRPATAPIAFGLVWFVVTQLPTSLYPLSEVENDHRMFFSFAGLVLATVWAGWLMVEWIARVAPAATPRPALVAFAVVVLAAYGYGVHRRNAVWHDEESLWRDDVRKSPHNGRGLMIYGLTQMNKGAYEDALRYFERAVEFTPNYATLEINLGVVCGALGDRGDQVRGAQAERHFLRAVALQPDDDTTHAFYGQWLSEHGRGPEALAEIERAIAANPARMLQRELLVQEYDREGDVDAALKAAGETLAMASGDAVARAALERPQAGAGAVAAWINRSLAQYQQGLFEQAIASARKALALDARSAEAWNNIGAAQAGMLQWTDSVASEREALRINPQLQIARNNLAAYQAHLVPSAETADGLLNESLRLHQAGQYNASLAAARRALRLKNDSAEAWNNIAANDEALRRWDEAIRAAQQAVALKPDFELAKNNLAWAVAQKKLATQ